MGFNLKRLQEVAKPVSAKELEEAQYREENRDWLLKSMQIALYLEHVLRVREISKKQLAEMIDVTPAQVTEKALGVSLINIPSEVRPYQFSTPIVTNVSVSNLPFQETTGSIESCRLIGEYSYMPRRHSKKLRYSLS